MLFLQIPASLYCHPSFSSYVVLCIVKLFYS
uniref:Uncharacterized protein n=1 Tax=Rhizophora mucronata TaxID=61149 RepID=A0A2P2N2B4_RHIMU